MGFRGFGYTRITHYSIDAPFYKTYEFRIIPIKVELPSDFDVNYKL